MSKSLKQFNRWKTEMKSTWAFQVFNKYNDELNNMIWADKAARLFVYKILGNNKAKWMDKASAHLKFDVPAGEEVFKNLKDWSDSYNQFHKWNNLNSLMAISANFETYLSTVITLALESDPGVLFQSSKSIDGIEILKNGGRKNIFIEDVITSITKGDWNARISAFKKIFGNTPSVLDAQRGNLEKIRILRNNIGHAFGRDINDSRNHEVKDILKMENLSDTALKKYQHVIWSTAKDIDEYLLKNHIGEFQAVSFYHRIYNEMNMQVHPSIRAIALKKKLGEFGDVSGKEFCKGPVAYYENL